MSVGLPLRLAAVTRLPGKVAHVERRHRGHAAHKATGTNCRRGAGSVSVTELPSTARSTSDFTPVRMHGFRERREGQSRCNRACDRKLYVLARRRARRRKSASVGGGRSAASARRDHSSATGNRRQPIAWRALWRNAHERAAALDEAQAPMLIARQADARRHPGSPAALARHALRATARGCVTRSAPDSSRPIPSAAHTRPGPRARSASRDRGRFFSMRSDAFRGFERADQHRGASLRRFGARFSVQAGAVHHARISAVPRSPEQRRVRGS